MQAKDLNGGQELLCINTEKVYDWIVNDVSFDLELAALDLPVVGGVQLTCDDIGTELDQFRVTCEVAPTTGEGGDPEPFVVVSREDEEFEVDGTLVPLQIVTIEKNFEVTIFLTPNAGGAAVEVGTEIFTRMEQVVLCAPEGTDIELSYTDTSCFVTAVDCPTDTDTVVDEIDIDVTVRLCQSIQSTFGVTLELLADFCQPREELPIAPCPTPTMPPQCPVLFPNGTNGDNG